MSNKQVFFATCAPGVEPLLHVEAKALRLQRLERQVGGVRFEGTWIDAWRANLWLRTAVRILLRLERFRALESDDLFLGASRIDWDRYLRPEGTLWVDAQTRESSLDHSRFIEQRVKDAIVDQMRERHGGRPTVSKDQPDLRVHVHIWRDRVTLSLDTSGDSLHKRGWRRTQGRAPLSETLAAAVVLASGWDRRSPLIDPFCGSGTLLVEGALIADNVAPGLTRPRFGFESWPGHDAKGFARCQDEARKAAKPARKLVLRGSDIDPQRIEEAQENLDAAGLAERVQLEVADAREFAPRPGWNACVVTNPPYGERLGRAENLGGLYQDFGNALRERCGGYRVGLLSGNPELAQQLGLAEVTRTPFLNGSIECELLTAELPLNQPV
ncbi:MAG: putative N6-adenine-specific DNA methylase [Planctomycetota bacterium]|jgi:putative N6-adenine-specific DNA methylase